MIFAPIHEANDCHNPPGSPEGGRFCSKGGGPRGFVQAVKAWGPSRTDVERPELADIRIGSHAELDLVVKPSLGANTVLLSALEVFPMRKGHGAAVMQRLTDLADAQGVTLALEALPLEPRGGGKSISVDKLRSFYERFGFKVESSDEHGDAYMFRRSKGPTQSPEGQKQAFMADLHNTPGAYVNPINGRELVLRNEAALEVYPVADGIRLSAVRAFEMKKGAGTRAMEDVLRLADKHGLTVYGTASPFGKGGMSKKQLLTWYKKFGFTADRGGNITRYPR